MQKRRTPRGSFDDDPRGSLEREGIGFLFFASCNPRPLVLVECWAEWSVHRSIDPSVSPCFASPGLSVRACLSRLAALSSASCVFFLSLVLGVRVCVCPVLVGVLLVCVGCVYFVCMKFYARRVSVAAAGRGGGSGGGCRGGGGGSDSLSNVELWDEAIKEGKEGKNGGKSKKKRGEKNFGLFFPTLRLGEGAGVGACCRPPLLPFSRGERRRTKQDRAKGEEERAPHPSGWVVRFRFRSVNLCCAIAD